MANASLSSPASPHFFQPLLPGFQSHLNIPVKFFSNHIKGKHEGKTVNLRSDASEKTWKVKMEGQRITEGWEEFVEGHDLRIGDFVVFRHEGDMFFHVTALGPSCCEIQYSVSRSREEDEGIDEIGKSSRKENVTRESDDSLSDLNCFSQTVTASNLSRDAVGVPMDFVRRNGLNKGTQEIVLMNEEGKSWDSELKSCVSSRVFVVRGWTSFCTANKLQIGDSCTFKLLPNTEKPVFRLCSRAKADPKKEIQSAEEDTIAEKIGENRFAKLTLTPNSLNLGKQHLPASFVRDNGLTNPGEIIMVDKDGSEWSMELKVDKSRGPRGSMYIMSTKGWKSFCLKNGVGANDYLNLELIRGGTTPLLKFCSKMEQPPIEVEARSHKRARVRNWSQEKRPKLDVREKTFEEGEPSHRTRASNKSAADQGNFQHTQSCSVSDQVTKVKQSVVDTLTSIKRIMAELETMEQKLEDSLQEISIIERRRHEE